MIAHRRIEGAVVAYGEIERLLAEEPASHWLADAERAGIDAMRHEPARRQRLAGRILAKMLVLRQLEAGAVMISCHPQQIQIDSRDGLGRRIAPRVSVAGRWLNGSLSISHSESIVAVVLSTDATRPVGVDITDLAANHQGTLALWLTAAEQRVAAASGPGGAARLWCLKEAAFKALAEGRHFRPLQWDVSECLPSRAVVAGVADSAAVDGSRFHADWGCETQAGVTAPVAESVSEPHGSQSRGPCSRTTGSEDVMTSGCRRTFTGQVCLQTARGWMSRAVDIREWNTADALICVVRARTRAWTKLASDDRPADGFDVETPRLQLTECCG